MTSSSLDVPEQLSRANSSFDTERHQHQNHHRRRHGLTIAPGVTTSPVWSDLPSRISEGHYRIDPITSSNTTSAPLSDTNIRAAYQHSGVRQSMYNQYSHPSSQSDEDHRYEHSTMLPLVDHPSNNTTPPDWPYQVGPSQPVLLRNFNSPIGFNGLQRFNTPSEMNPRKRSRLTWATYLILLTLLISSTTAAFLFFSGRNYEQSNEVTSAATTNSPSFNPVLAASTRTSNANSTQLDSPSSASSAYYYYYYYPTPTSPTGINQSDEAGTSPGTLKMPSSTPLGVITPTSVSNPIISPSSSTVKKISILPSLSLVNQPSEGVKSIVETKQLSNVTNNATTNIQTPVGTPTVTSYTTTSATQSNNDDPFPADSLNDDRIRTGDDVTNILSSANTIEVDKVTGAITTTDDATSKVTTTSGNGKTDDDPISMYPASDSRSGTNLTFQGYDDGFDDSVHDDAFPVDDTFGNGENKNQVNTALTGSTGAEFIPQQSAAGSSNFDFGGKADDSVSKSSTNADFGSSSSDLNLNIGDDPVTSGDDFQSIIDGISTSIMKFSPSNQTSSNMTSTDESPFNNTGSKNYTNESSNLTYIAPISNPPTTYESSSTNTPVTVQPTYAQSHPPTTLPMKDTNTVAPSHPAPASIPIFSTSVKVKKETKVVSSEPSSSFRPHTSPLYSIPSTQPAGPSLPSVSFTPLKNQPKYAPNYSPAMTPMKVSNIQPTQASIPSFSPSDELKKDMKADSSEPSPSFRPFIPPFYFIPSMQPAVPPDKPRVSIVTPTRPAPKGVYSEPSTLLRPVMSPMYLPPSMQPARPFKSIVPFLLLDFAPLPQPVLSSQPSSSPAMDFKNIPEAAPSIWQPTPYLQNTMSPSRKEYLLSPNLSAGDNMVTVAPSSTKLNLDFPPFGLSGGGYYYYYYYPPSSRRKR